MRLLNPDLPELARSWKSTAVVRRQLDFPAGKNNCRLPEKIVDAGQAVFERCRLKYNEQAPCGCPPRPCAAGGHWISKGN
jgi:hypothetical protein